ncbi:MAG: hypothetical protein J0H75_13800, partial [Rhizobiales bacterium]|nr:hypothetical protein [Hyphomicrobiales bacterium]
ENQTWMAGTSPAMTESIRAPLTSFCSYSLSKVIRPSAKEKCPALRPGIRLDRDLLKAAR